MADNPYVNKVEFGSQTLMDITDTTAESQDVVQGKKFYAANGAPVVGSLITASPSDATPAMDGIGNSGSSTSYSRGDHVHPTDTSRADQAQLDAFLTPKTIGPIALASFDDGVDGAILGKCVVNIEPVQSGSGDPSPTNVRPISGWTGAKVSVTGKNLIDQSVSPYFTGTRLNDWILPLHDNIVPQLNKLDAGIYTVSVSFILSDSTSDGVFGFYILNGDVGITCFLNNTPIEGGKKTTVTATFEITEQMVGNFDYAWVYAGNSSSVTPTTYTELQIERGAAPTEYEPFGTNYTITFPSEAGTVYGGTLDVELGLLTVDRGYILFDGSSDEVWETYSVDSEKICFFITGIPEKLNSYDEHISISNRYINVPYCYFTERYRYGAFCNYGYNDGRMYFCQPNQDIKTLEDWKTWLASNNFQLVYPLATPQTYQLTPVQVRTLLGLNNIYADCGDVTVQVRGDVPNLYELIARLLNSLEGGSL